MPDPTSNSQFASISGDLVNAGAQIASNQQNYSNNSRLQGQNYWQNLELWNLQNQYNLPKNQMARFRDAGLNPNLIYGQGNSGNAAPISAPTPITTNFQPVRIGDALKTAGLSRLNNLYDLEIKKATVDNLKAQNEVIKEDAILKRTTRSRGQFDLDFESELRDVSAESRRERLRQTRVTTDNSIDENARRAVQNTTSIQEAAERMLTMQERRKAMPLERDKLRKDILRTDIDIQRGRQNIKLLQQQGELNELNLQLQRLGINPGDETWQRVVGRILNDVFETGNSSLLDWLGF